jgi:hypothetical protein
MDELLLSVITHPFAVIQIFMSLWGAFGVVMFFWGLIGYFLSHGHVDHQDHARAQMVWGVLLTGGAILVWEILRFLAYLIS